MTENFNTDVNKLLNQILRLNNSIFVFQTDILKTSIKYRLKPNYVANEIISNIEKIFKKKNNIISSFFQ